MSSSPIPDEERIEIKEYLIEHLPNVEVNLIDDLVNNLKNDALLDMDPADIVVALSKRPTVEKLSLTLHQDSEIEQNFQGFLGKQSEKFNLLKVTGAILIAKSIQTNKIMPSLYKLSRVLGQSISEEAVVLSAIYLMELSSPALEIDLVLAR